MRKLRPTINAVFVVSLAALLIAGIVFVAGQALALLTGQGGWLSVLDDAVKAPACIAASVCAIAGFLLSYGAEKRTAETITGEKEDQHRQQQEARTP
jgi:hypothetical protein